MEKDNNIMKGQGEDGKWITVNGTHVFVEEGQSVEDAMNSKFDKKSRADEDLTKRAEALHKTMKEAGLPVKKSIEETKAIMRNLDKMPDYGDEDAKDKPPAKVKTNVDDITEENIDKVISDLPVGGEIAIQLTGGHIEGLNTLHIQRKNKDYFKLWNSNANGLIANENNYSSLSNTIFWAKRDFNKVESIK